MNCKITKLMLVATLLVLVCGWSSARAQDALGGGDALDANLGVGGRVNAPRPQENFRERNLIVTGDVAGGRGFRGSVGYTASADFRGNLGSNDIFPFLASSAYSSPALFQLGSTYEQLRFGQAVGALEFRRAQSGAPSAIHPQNPVPNEQIRSAAGVITPFEQLRLDRMNLASSASMIFQSAVEPQIVGLTYNQQNQPFLFNASSLRGITVEPMNQSPGTVGLSTMDTARIRQDIERGAVPPIIGTPFETDFEDAPTPGAALRHDPAAAPSRVDASIVRQPDYANILNQIAERYAVAKGQQANAETLKQLQDDYQALRAQLRTGPGGARDRVSNRVGSRIGDLVVTEPELEPQRSSVAVPSGIAGVDLPVVEPSDTGPIVQSPLDQPRPGELIPSESTTPRQTLDRMGDQRPGAQATDQPDQHREQSPSQMANLLRHGQRVERFSGENQDRFNELLASAEQKLRDGDFFVAEHRFERALRFIPGHPMAMAGIGHAQLGGGLYLSAALTLQTLLTNHPEMIDTTFADDLLPPRERLDRAVQLLRTQIKEPRERGSYGFLLAYIGHQVGDRQLIAQGLDAMAEANSENPLLPLLRELWLTPPALRDSKRTPPPPPQADPQK